MTNNLNVGMRCIKYMLFVANFMFFMVGVLLISIGSTITSIYNEFELFMKDHYFSPAALIIAVGVIVMLIAAFGCVAAIKESVCMVNMFALLLTLALILEVSASIAAYAMRVNIRLLLEEKMNDTLANYSNDTESKEAFDMLQEKLGCCGINTKNDWSDQNFTYGENVLKDSNYNVPESCCRFRLSSGKYCVPYEHGCLNKLTFIVSESALMLATGALCFAFLQVLGISFAVLLAKHIRRLKTQAAVARWQTRQELYLQLARGNEKSNPTPVVYTPEGAQVDS